MIKVSIIVPVHDSAAYLHKCVESLLAQTLEETEIILVDDCSSDGSPGIIADYAARFPDKVRGLYLPENLRQGGARNRGMEIARGEYIAFVDADDFVEPRMCRSLYEAAAGADMCGADYYIDAGGDLKTVVVDYGESRELTAQGRERAVKGCGYFWSRIYRREFLREQEIRFPEGTFYEDAYFNFLTILCAKTLVKAPGTYYHYYQSPGSTVRRTGDARQYERIAIPSLIMQACRERGLYDRYRDLVDWKYISMQMSNIVYTCLGQFETPDPVQLERIRQAVRAECPEFARCVHYRQAPRPLRAWLRLTLVSPALTVGLYKHGMDRLLDRLAAVLNKLKRRKEP